MRRAPPPTRRGRGFGKAVRLASCGTGTSGDGNCGTARGRAPAAPGRAARAVVLDLVDLAGMHSCGDRRGSEAHSECRSPAHDPLSLATQRGRIPGSCGFSTTPHHQGGHGVGDGEAVANTAAPPAAPASPRSRSVPVPPRSRPPGRAPSRSPRARSRISRGRRRIARPTLVERSIGGADDKVEPVKPPRLRAFEPPNRRTVEPSRNRIATAVSSSSCRELSSGTVDPRLASPLSPAGEQRRPATRHTPTAVLGTAAGRRGRRSVRRARS
jgi:hypothetical protein